MGKSWFQTGDEGINRSKVEDAAARKRKEQAQTGAWRFSQKANETAKIVVVDDSLFFVHEHNLYNLTKNYGDYATCVRDFEEGGCHFCETIGNPSYCAVMTIIDTRKYTSEKDHKTYQYQRRLFVAKGKAREILLRRYQENGKKLKGYVLQVTRGSSVNEAATGEDIQVLKKVDGETLKKMFAASNPQDGQKITDWFKPFDYTKIFAPMTAQQMRKMTGAAAPVGSDDDLLGGDSASEVSGADSVDDLIGDDSSADVDSGTDDDIEL